MSSSASRPATCELIAGDAVASNKSVSTATSNNGRIKIRLKVKDISQYNHIRAMKLSRALVFFVHSKDVSDLLPSHLTVLLERK